MKNIRKSIFLIVFVIIFSCVFSPISFAAKPDRTPPTAPTNLRTVSVTDTSVLLAWNASTDNKGIASYYVYKNNTYIFSTVNTTYTVSGLTPGQTYQFYIKAKDTAGNISQPSNILSIKTLQPVVTPTPVPTSTTTPIPTVTPIPTATPTPVPTQTKKIVGYYASWAAYSGFTPDKIDATKVTHINYAFANVGTDLKIAVGDSYIDFSNFNKLNTLKQQYPNLKTLITVGGWNWSDKFSDVAYTDSSRTVFANSCLSFILTYGFDGVDLDWEYPVSGGLSTNVKRPEDKQNFTLLLKKLRETFDSQSLIDGKHYLITIAGGSGTTYVNNTELGILHQYLDYANIMTYDIHGSWDTYTDFNAPLYNNTDTSPQYKWSVDKSVKAWLNAGFPASKLVLGIPFYGYKYTGVTNANNGLYQRFTGCSAVTYFNIVNNYLNTAGYTKFYHSQSMVPWLFNGTTFISYEDEQSIGMKAQYIKSNGLAGGMIWELSQDPNKVLLTALFNGLQ